MWFPWRHPRLHPCQIGNVTWDFQAKNQPWRMFVKGDTHLLRSVDIELHHTYRQRYHTLNASNDWLFESTAYGSFTIKLTLRWKSGEVYKDTWGLNLTEMIASKTIKGPRG